VGDHYFGLAHTFNFHDLDMIVLGEAAAESSQIFDYFWNSDRVIPASAFVPDASWDPIAAAWDEETATLRGNQDLARFPVDPRDWDRELTALVDRMSPGTATVEFHRLVPGTPIPTEDGVAKLAEIVHQAEREVMIVNAYVIPGERAMEIVRSACDRGVRVRILTNSLASQEVPAVTSKYKKYRRPLLEAGAELYELKANPAIQAGIVDTPPVESGFSGLHTKTVVVDREKVYIGSLNLDPRSMRLNTEMGMIVTSPGLAQEVARIAERDMEPANSWQVHLDDNGKLTWACDEGVVTRQPARSWWQRVEVWFMGIAPESEF
jgi:putative cardiolipin synthase